MKTVELKMILQQTRRVKYHYSLFSDMIVSYEDYEIFSILTLATETKFVFKIDKFVTATAVFLPSQGLKHGFKT